MRSTAFALILAVMMGCVKPSTSPVPAPRPAVIQGSPVPVPAGTVVQLGFYKPRDASIPMVDLTAFDPPNVRGFTEKMKALDGKTPEIWVRIDTMGGSISGGEDVIHTLEAMKSYVVCVADFKAYSMGFDVLQSTGCDYRLMTQRASLMMHEAQLSSQGGPGELRDAALLLEAISEGFVIVAAQRMQVDAEALRVKISRRMWWLDWREAQRWRAVDGFVDPKALPPPTPYEVKKNMFEALFGD